MISKIIQDNGKRELDHKIYSTLVTCPTVTMYGNPGATKNFLTKRLLKMIDSSVKHLGKVEYDN